MFAAGLGRLDALPAREPRRDVHGPLVRGPSSTFQLLLVRGFQTNMWKAASHSLS